MQKGYLTHTITAIEEHGNSLEAMTGLPKQAEKTKNKAVSTINESVDSLEGLQQKLQVAAQQLYDDLQQAMTLVAKDTQESLEHIQNCYERAQQLSQRLEDHIEDNKNSRDLFFTYHQELNDSLLALEKESAELTVEAQKARDKANKFKKERYYFLALGPFGLTGLATATGLFTTWSNKADKARKAASNSKNELRILQLFKENIGTLQNSFGMSVEVLSGSKNGLVLLMGNIHNILNNTAADNDDETVVMSLYLNAAIKEAAVFMVDVA